MPFGTKSQRAGENSRNNSRTFGFVTQHRFYITSISNADILDSLNYTAFLCFWFYVLSLLHLWKKAFRQR